MKPIQHATLLLATLSSLAAKPATPLINSDTIFEEKDGLIAIEAEHFHSQTITDTRAWYLTTKENTPKTSSDGDANHVGGASGGAYLEILPDTRRNHGEKLIVGENFAPEPGKLAILSYKIHFNTPGKYWLWARAYSTNSEDNGLHFGINNTWPETAARWQTVAKRHWHWRSAQRTAKKHSGVPGILTLDVPSAGLHTIQVSMREDGFELDKILLANRKDYTPEGLGPKSTLKSGKLPKRFPFVEAGPDPDPKPKPKKQAAPKATPSAQTKTETKQSQNLSASATPREPANPIPAKVSPGLLKASDFDFDGTNYYLDQGKWAAINPDKAKTATVSNASPFPPGLYHLTLQAVGENDGQCTYSLEINDAVIGYFRLPLAKEAFEEGPKYHTRFPRVEVNPGDVIKISSTIHSADGKEYARARWSGLAFTPANDATKLALAQFKTPAPKTAAPTKPAGPPLQQPRQPSGDGSLAITGELKQWHKVTLTLDGPYAHELDNKPNPFTDCLLTLTCTHASGSPKFTIPGYFAADGNAAETSAQSGTKWRAHFSPNKPGVWNFTLTLKHPGAALSSRGSFSIAPSDKQAPDLRARGRLAYVGKHHLQFQGDKTYFLKAGADAPETLLAYADFDGTVAKKKNVPLKTWSPHIRDWKPGDPTWQNGKGKGLIGALNYLAYEGCNVFSFLPYNAGGDGDNVWPFVSRNDKFHYDCSKLDQWGIVFDHATTLGHYLHFKLQETEIDDNRRGLGDKSGSVPTALDGGKLGPERKLYLREIIARYGHLLALNWNLGEENTQTTQEQLAMADYLRSTDPYNHHIVIHTFPQQQDKVYNALLGKKQLTGVSLQNSNLRDCHKQVLKWSQESRETGHPWVVAFDEPGNAQIGMPADPDYPGMEDYKGPTIHDTRKYTLWGTLMAGGTGVEYYFGYKIPQNDLLCEDWRSRDKSWDYCRYALAFFNTQNIPFHDMVNRNDLIGNPQNDNSKYCFAKEGEIYLVYLPNGGSTDIKLPGTFKLTFYNPRNANLYTTLLETAKTITAPDENDRLAIHRKKRPLQCCEKRRK
ncbi:MAG: DUF5060 domain-containing protein [Verrucomicrobiota bacterium]